MESTFRIQGRASDGRPALGTGFLLRKSDAKDPPNHRVVLVTAAHVFSNMAGDSVTLMMRRQDDSGWRDVPVIVSIRSNGRNLWTQNNRADVAALYLSDIPAKVAAKLIPTTALANDDRLTEYDIHPGDELNVLGYPLGYSSAGGFAVLRSGKIASYPILPTLNNPFFLLDFRVFKGNSGGPVYVSLPFRATGGGLGVSQTPFIAGLVSEEVSATEQFQGLYENRSETYPLGLAKIVPASFIIETINSLDAR